MKNNNNRKKKRYILLKKFAMGFYLSRGDRDNSAKVNKS